MTKDDELLQALWDYVYGLLEPAEAKALEQRITSEHEVARAYAEVRQQADLLGAAARVDMPTIALRTPKAPKSAVCVARTTWTQASVQLVTALALVVLVVLASGIAWRRQWLNDPGTIAAIEESLAEEQVRLLAAAPPQLVSEEANFFSVQATNLLDQPVAGEVRYDLLATTGETLASATTTTNTNGIATLAFSANDLAAANRLQLTWCKADNDASLAFALPEVTPHYRTHLTTDRTQYQAGDLAQFRSVTLAAEAPRDLREFNVNYALCPTENTYAPVWQGAALTNQGVGSGGIPLAHVQPGVYHLFARSANHEFLERMQTFVVSPPEVSPTPTVNELALVDLDGVETVELKKSDRQQPRADSSLLVTQPILPQREFVELRVEESSTSGLLLATATCRGLLIGQQPLASDTEATRQRLSLAPAGDGLIHIAVQDHGLSPPATVAEQWCYRAPTEYWQVAAEPIEASGLPTEQPNAWSIVVRDEQQRPGAAILGVRVVANNSATVPTLAEDYYFATSAETGAAFYDLDFTLRNAESAQQLAQRLPTLKTPPANGPRLQPVLHSNGTQVQERFQQAVEEWQANRLGELQQVVRWLTIGSVATLLILLVLPLVKQGGAAWQWWPQLTVAGLLLIAAMNWQGSDSSGLTSLAVRQWPPPPQSAAIEALALDLTKSLEQEELTRLQEFPDLPFEAKVAESLAAEQAEQPRGQALALNAAQLSFGSQRWTDEQWSYGLETDLYARFLSQLSSTAGVANGAHAFYFAAPSDKLAEDADRPAPDYTTTFDSDFDNRWLRRDLRSRSQTLYWKPQLPTDAQGRAEVRFVLPDNQQDYLLIVDVHGQGRLGALRLPLRRSSTVKP